MQISVSGKRSKIINMEIMAIIIIILLFLSLFPFPFVSIGNAYYGFSGLGLYGRGIYGGLGLYGLGGLYDLGLYGLYGGIGRAYGFGGFCGLNGLYGLYGLGGLYGLSGISGLYNRLGGLGGFLGTMGLLSGLGLINSYTQIIAPPAPIVTAEQAGTWSGSWISFLKLKAGLMNMTLVEDISTGTLSGQVNLILNGITKSIPADITGPLPTALDGVFILTGGNQAFLATTLLATTTLPSYIIELECTMTSPTTMTGTYMVQNTVSLSVDYGNFDLALTAPVI